MRVAIIVIVLFNWQMALAGDSLDVRTLGDGDKSPAADISALSWLAGAWTGPRGEGQAQELIAPPLGGQMMGMYREVNGDGALTLYEFYVFAEVDDTLTLRLKHFSPEMIGWEEKDEYVEFPLVAIEGEIAYFDGITYARTGADAMQAAVNVGEGNILYFDYYRSPRQNGN